MEIQTIQEALAGAKRVGEFLELPTRLETYREAGEKAMTELGKASAASGSDYALWKICLSRLLVKFGTRTKK